MKSVKIIVVIDYPMIIDALEDLIHELKLQFIPEEWNAPNIMLLNDGEIETTIPGGESDATLILHWSTVPEEYWLANMLATDVKLTYGTCGFKVPWDKEYKYISQEGLNYNVCIKPDCEVGRKYIERAFAELWTPWELYTARDLYEEGYSIGLGQPKHPHNGWRLVKAIWSVVTFRPYAMGQLGEIIGNLRK